jgi:hypothetical protein
LKKRILNFAIAIFFICNWCNQSFAQTFTVTGVNAAANGITQGTLFFGQTDIVLFGFSVSVNTGTRNITAFTIQNTANVNQMLSNGKIYRSTTNTFASATQITGVLFNFPGSYASISGLNETITTTPVYYFIVADFTSTNYTSGTMQFNFGNTTSPPNIQTNPYATIGVTTTNGTNFTVGATYNWVGKSNTTFSNASNYTNLLNNATATVPGANDMVRIGAVGYQFPNAQPIVTANITVGKLLFGTNNAPVLTVNTGVVLTVSKDITLNTSASATITSTGTGTVSGAATLTTNTGSALTQSGSAVVNLTGAVDNNGTINKTSTGALTLSGAVDNSGTITQGAGGLLTLGATANAIANSGTINHNGTGGITFAGDVTSNTGTITQNATSGAITFNRTLNNSNIINKVGTGTVTFTGVVTNNNGGEITQAGSSGLMTFTAAINNSGDIKQTAAGPVTFTNNFANAATGGVTLGNNAGILTLSGATLTNNGSFDLDGGTTNIAATTFSNTSTGTFNATSGSVNFSRAGVQAINNANTTTPVTFYNLILSGGNFVKTLGGTGKFEINSLGSIELIGATSTTATDLAAGANLLTLNSDATGTANVKTIPIGSTITGTVNVERYVTGGSTTLRTYRLFSSPVYDATVSTNNVYDLAYLTNTTSYTTGTTGTGGGFTASGNPTIYFFRDNLAPNNTSFISGNFRGVNKINNGVTIGFDAEPSTYNIPVGNGFLFYFRSGVISPPPILNTTVAAPSTYTTSGTLNQGDITVKHWYTPTLGTLQYSSVTNNSTVMGFNLVGNPYASSIDWDKLNTGIIQTNLSPTIWVYNPYKRAYTSYVAGAGGVGTNQDFTTTASANIIVSGQGFFVRATAASPTLKFTESAKVTTQVLAPNLMMSTAPVADPPLLQYLRIEVAKDSTDKEDALIFFKNSAKPEFAVNEDAEYLKGNSIVNIATRSADRVALAINQTTFPKKSQVIPLIVNITANGLYHLNLTQAINIPRLYEVWLKDAYKKDSLDIKHNPTYNFNASLSDTASFGANRFSLIIRQDPAFAYRLLGFSPVKDNGTVALVWSTENEADNTYFTVERSIDGGKTYDILGSVPAKGLGTYSLTDKSPAKGLNLYRLKQEDANGVVSYSKVVSVRFDEPAAVSAGVISVYPNPAGSALNIVLSNAVKPATAYRIVITGSTGRVVKTINAPQPEWHGDISALLPGSYFINVYYNTDNAFIGRASFVKL